MIRRARCIYAAVLFSFMAVSCAMEKEYDDEGRENTLQEEVIKRENKADWTMPLEEKRLKERIDSHGGIAKGIVLSPLIAAVSLSDEEAIYPALEGFTSLDNRGITGEMQKTINAFIDIMKNDGDLSEVMIKGMEYSAFFFIEDVKKDFMIEKGIDKVIEGKPFFDKGEVIVPLRLSNEYGYCYVDVCMREVEEDKADSKAGERGYSMKITQLLYKGGA